VVVVVVDVVDVVAGVVDVAGVVVVDGALPGVRPMLDVVDAPPVDELVVVCDRATWSVVVTTTSGPGTPGGGTADWTVRLQPANAMRPRMTRMDAGREVNVLPGV
jgi:hypothetical protein